MFRAVSGIWPFGTGTIATPPGTQALLLPQMPYIPQGTLRAAVTYPAETGAFDECRDPGRAGGSQAVAPDRSARCRRSVEPAPLRRRAAASRHRARAAGETRLAVLDEATAALDEPLEAEVYGVLRGLLPATTVVSSGTARR